MKRMQRSVAAVGRVSNHSAYKTGQAFQEVIEDLEKRIQVLEEYIDWDMKLREQNPVLQDLFEKFQATKKLIGPGE